MIINIELDYIHDREYGEQYYKDMLTLYDNVTIVIKYSIKGNLQGETVKLIIRIECTTTSNCALEELEKIVPELSKSSTRLQIFKRINTLLNKEKSGLW